MTPNQIESLFIMHQCEGCGMWYQHDEFYLFLLSTGYFCYECKGAKEAQAYV